MREPSELARVTVRVDAQAAKERAERVLRSGYAANLEGWKEISAEGARDVLALVALLADAEKALRDERQHRRLLHTLLQGAWDELEAAEEHHRWHHEQEGREVEPRENRLALLLEMAGALDDDEGLLADLAALAELQAQAEAGRLQPYETERELARRVVELEAVVKRLRRTLDRAALAAAAPSPADQEEA